ncbi:uncharacterized protein CLUP02_00871 [Colletotrichum lupini]|uniref:Uncharacterized protein n=1 Tax=Colletotrichum lupini TaxID=145971 RepID=A0A9Q8SBX0_9PEZI|nr:uncharacterized protein CLUP02_00871 [Colletotrichum lupini]UQC74223.1 hypothetical protein CLUP02_00871 [Colletotrichum lupini]
MIDTHALPIDASIARPRPLSRSSQVFGQIQSCTVVSLPPVLLAATRDIGSSSSSSSSSKTAHHHEHQHR